MFSIALEAAVGRADGADGPVAPHTLEGLALLVPLLNGIVMGVGVDELGDLSSTVGRAELRCAGRHDFQAWNLSGPDGVLVCAPGGELVVWSAGSPLAEPGPISRGRA